MLGGQNQQVDQIVGMDHRETLLPETRHKMNAESKDGTKQGQAPGIALAQHDRRSNDRRGHAIGQTFDGTLARPLAAAVMRSGRRRSDSTRGRPSTTGPAAASDETWTSTGGVGCRAHALATWAAPR